MDWEAFYKKVDAQIAALAAKPKEARERRQQQIAVSEERRSGQDRRGVRRALAALVGGVGARCDGDCNQGRSCHCRDK